jgi:hypothetical protein
MLRAVATICSLLIYGCSGLANEARPKCEKPAPLKGRFDHRAPGYFIALDVPEDQFWATIGRWERDYHLHFGRGSRETRTVQSNLTPAEVAILRCDRSVTWLEYDGVIAVGYDASVRMLENSRPAKTYKP